MGAKSSQQIKSQSGAAPPPDPVFYDDDLKKAHPATVGADTLYDDNLQPIHPSAPRSVVKAFGSVPPPPTDSSADDSDNHGVVGNLGLGFAKGAGRTATELGHLFDPVTAYRYFTGNSSPSPMEQATPDAEQLTEPHGIAQNVGYFGEKIGETLLPMGATNKAIKGAAAGADLVLPSGRVAAELPAITSRLGRAAVSAGTEGLVQSGVAGAQTGGDPHAMAWAGLTAGLVRGGAQYLSKAERLRAAAQNIVDSTKGLPAKQAGELIQSRIKDVYNAAGQAIGQQYGDIAAKAQGVTVRVDKSLPALQDLLAEIEGPMQGAGGTAGTGFESVGNADDISKARSILHDLTEQYKTVDTGLLDAQGNPITHDVPKQLDVQDALRFRTLLFKLSSSPEFKGSIGKGALSQATKAWHGEIVDALQSANPALAQQFTDASSAYRTMLQRFNQKTIQTMVKNGTPERIVNVLTGPGGESNVQNLRALIGAKNMPIVRASVWRNVLEGAQPADGSFLGGQVRSTLDKLSPNLQKELFGGPEQIVKMQRFADLADSTWMHNYAHRHLTDVVTQGAGRAAGRMAVGAAVGGGLTALHQGMHGEWMYGAAAGGMAGVIAPTIMARLLSKPGSVDIMTKALTADATTHVGKQLIAKIAGLAAGEIAAAAHDTKDHEAVEGAKQFGAEFTRPSTPAPSSPPYADDDEAGIGQVMADHSMTREQAIDALKQRGHIQ